LRPAAALPRTATLARRRNNRTAGGDTRPAPGRETARRLTCSRDRRMYEGDVARLALDPSLKTMA